VQGEKENRRTNAFYHPGPLKKFPSSAQAITHQKNHAQPKGKKKFSSPKKFRPPPTPSSPRPQKIMVRL